MSQVGLKKYLSLSLFLDRLPLRSGRRPQDTDLIEKGQSISCDFLNYFSLEASSSFPITFLLNLN